MTPEHEWEPPGFFPLAYIDSPEIEYFRQRIIEERLKYPAVIYGPAYIIPRGLTDGAGI